MRACMLSLQEPRAIPYLLLLLTTLALAIAQRQYPIPPLEVSAPNTWGRVVFRKHWIDPNSMKPVPCKQPVGRCAATTQPLCVHAAIMCARNFNLPNVPLAPYSALILRNRHGHTLLLRSTEMALYLFGGLDGRGRFLNDLWRFKLSPSDLECDWQEIFPPQSLAEQYVLHWLPRCFRDVF